MLIDVLGPLLVRDDAGDEINVGGDRARALLAALATAETPMSVSEMASGLWDDTSEIHPNAIQAAVYRLRRLLGVTSIETVGHSYRLGDAVLVHRRFLDLVAAARGRNEPDAVLEEVHEALALWRGRPLDDLAEPLRTRRSEPLLAAYDEARELRLQARLTVGPSRDDADDARRLVEEQPFREERWHLLLRLLRATGRRADALHEYARLRVLLRDELGVEPSKPLQELHLGLLSDDDAARAVLWRSDATGAGEVFIGRENELEQLDTSSGRHPAVVVVGPGGAGKTRLVSEYVSQRQDAVRIWISCAGASTVAQLVEAVAWKVLVSPPAGPVEEALTSVLGELDALLVLDNLEQIDGAGEMLTRWLAAAPRLRVIVTSRTPLHCPAADTLTLSGLQTPRTDRAEDVAASNACRLFAARVRQVRPGWRWQDNAAAVASIVRRLDGLPLALEIVAARARLSTVEELAADIDTLLPLRRVDDSEGRHGSVADAVGWSYDLLGAEAASLLRRLAVVPSATPDDLAQMHGLDLPTANALCEELVRHSLAVREGARLRLLETVRSVARARTDDVERRSSEHAVDMWCVRRFARMEQPTFAQSPEDAMDFDEATPVLRESLLRLEQRDRDAWLDVLLACFGPWWQFGHSGELIPALTRAYEVVPYEHRRRPHLAVSLGVLHANDGRAAEAEPLLREARTHPASGPGERAVAMAFEAWHERRAGRPGAAYDLARSAVATAATGGPDWALSWCLLALADAAAGIGDEATELAAHEEAVLVARRSDARASEAGALMNGGVALMARDPKDPRAASLFARALELATAVRFRELEAGLRMHAALASLLAGDLGTARQLADVSALTLVRTSQERWMAGMVQLQAALARAEGDPARARRLVDGLSAVGPDPDDLEPRLAALLEDVGSPGEPADPEPLRSLVEAGMGRSSATVLG